MDDDELGRNLCRQKTKDTLGGAAALGGGGEGQGSENWLAAFVAKGRLAAVQQNTAGIEPVEAQNARFSELVMRLLSE